LTTKDEVLRVAEAHRVGLHGYLLDRDLDGSAAADSFRNASVDYVEQVERVRRWSQRYTRRRTLNRSITSRLICVRASRESNGPVEQGCLIIACILQGISVRQAELGNPEAFTALSFKHTSENPSPQAATN
jgi:hypothetical protein